MTKDTRFKPGQSGNPQTRFKSGNRHRWQPGQSGNSAGVSRSRQEFEEAFYAALLERGSAEEAASLLWEPARKGEPWAVQALLQRLAPESKTIKITQGLHDDTVYDYGKLTYEELDELERLHTRAAVQSATGEGGEGTAAPEGFRDPGLADPGAQR